MLHPDPAHPLEVSRVIEGLPVAHLELEAGAPSAHMHPFHHPHHGSQFHQVAALSAPALDSVQALDLRTRQPWVAPSVFNRLPLHPANPLRPGKKETLKAYFSVAADGPSLSRLATRIAGPEVAPEEWMSGATVFSVSYSLLKRRWSAPRIEFVPHPANGLELEDDIDALAFDPLRGIMLISLTGGSPTMDRYTTVDHRRAGEDIDGASLFALAMRDADFDPAAFRVGALYLPGGRPLDAALYPTRAMPASSERPPKIDPSGVCGQDPREDPQGQ